jgi:hypothetical protein
MTRVLYNLQHKDYDNNLVKDNSRKEIAGELHTQDKEQHDMCESAFKTAGERRGNSMGTAWYV